MSDAIDLSYSALALGREASHDYVITPAIYQSFVAAFEDRSPIHVDEEVARARGFAGRVMHGSILNGFLSHFVGMCLPGRRSLLLTVDMRFAQPSYLGDCLRLTGTVSQRLEVQQVVVINFVFTNLTRGVTAATGRIQVKVSE